MRRAQGLGHDENCRVKKRRGVRPANVSGDFGSSPKNHGVPASGSDLFAGRKSAERDVSAKGRGKALGSKRIGERGSGGDVWAGGFFWGELYGGASVASGHGERAYANNCSGYQ